MAVWVEYNDAYEVRLHRTNLRKIQEVEADEGIILFFGEIPSKSGSLQLMSVAFLKEYWTIEEAVLWWTEHQIYFVPKRHRGKKFPKIDWIIDNGRNYILACLRGKPKNDTLARFFAES